MINNSFYESNDILRPVGVFNNDLNMESQSISSKERTRKTAPLYHRVLIQFKNVSVSYSRLVNQHRPVFGRISVSAI
jgi:hypothetical protein